LPREKSYGIKEKAPVSLHEAGRRAFPISLAPRREKGPLQNGVFQDLGRTQTDNGLSLDLDRFAGLGIAVHAGFAMSLVTTRPYIVPMRRP